MIEANIYVKESITSFLLECLFWNVPNNIFNDNLKWSEQLKSALQYIYSNTKTEERCNKWCEVSELLYLFVGRKWTTKDVNEFVESLWEYSEF